MLEYSEFLALYQSIETENSFDENLIRSIFIKECDLIISTTDEKALSLDKFVYLSIKNNFFKKEAVEKFIINVPIYV